MIKISGIDNQSIEIRLVNYQFPDSLNDEFDANWLNVHFDIHSKLGDLHKTDPCLLTWEVQALIDWFKDLASNKAAANEIFFTEPNFAIEKTGAQNDKIELHFNFALELRPNELIAKKPYYNYADIDYYMVGVFTNTDLQNLAREFELELSKFPLRAVKG